MRPSKPRPLSVDLISPSLSTNCVGVAYFRAFERFHFAEVISDHVPGDHREILVYGIFISAFEALQRDAAFAYKPVIDELNKVLDRIFAELLSAILIFASGMEGSGNMHSDRGVIPLQELGPRSVIHRPNSAAP